MPLLLQPFLCLYLVFYYFRQNGLKWVFRENNAEWMQMSIDKLICQKEPSSRLGVFFLLSSASSYNTNLFSFLSEKVEFHALSFAFTLISSSLSLTVCMYVSLLKSIQLMKMCVLSSTFSLILLLFLNSFKEGVLWRIKIVLGGEISKRQNRNFLSCTALVFLDEDKS